METLNTSFLLKKSQTKKENAMNNKEMIEYFSHKENILTWFGDRGIDLCSRPTKGCLHLSKFKWIDNKLFYVIKGTHDGWASIEKTETGKIDMCYTHRENGSSIIVYELYGSYKGTFKDIDEIAKRIKIKELQELEENRIRELKYAKENEAKISSLQIGNILIENDGMRNIKFLQVINKNEDLNELTVTVKELKKIYLKSTSSGMDYKVSCKLNEFSDNSKDVVLTKKNYIPKLFEKEFAWEYAGY